MNILSVLKRPRVKAAVAQVDRFARPWGMLVANPWVLVAGVFTLLAAHAALHGFVFTGLPRDELESVYWGQGWALGYDIQQPPLHNWIALALMEMFGASPALFGLNRVVTIGAMLLFLGLSARSMSGGRSLAATVTVLGALTTVLFGLQIFLNLTHSLMLLAALAFCLWTLTRLARPEAGPGTYLLVGSALGLGALSKYSFALFALALLAAVLVHPQLRKRLWDRRSLWALGLAVLLVLPHGVWMLLADHGIAGEMAGILKAKPLAWTDRLPDILRTAWVDPIAGVITPLILVALAAPGVFALRFVRGSSPGAEGEDPTLPWRRFLVVYLVASLTLATLVTLALGGSELRDHYMMPAVLVVPLWLGLRVSVMAPEGKTLSRIGVALGGGALVMGLGLLGGMALIRPMTCGRCLTDLPVAAWSEALRESGFSQGTLVANDLDGGANLLSRFPGSTLVVPNLDPAPGTEGAGTGLWAVVLDPRAPSEATEAVKAWVAAQGRSWPETFQEISGPVRGPFTDQMRSLSLALVPAP
ncbi:glycosyltransferase family 39 protein [Rhodospirillum sp. A1_3_36]|uniref:glycosyltransferase family 39 protein n=1 Tax=Rhodospirillum sp. A1_3_36 TaxID=3391666 RepID=UPI0039A68519